MDNIRYEWALNRKKRVLVAPKKGSYTSSGARITWSGPLGKVYGIIKTRTRIDLFAPGEKFAGSSCYRLKN